MGCTVRARLSTYNTIKKKPRACVCGLFAAVVQALARLPCTARLMHVPMPREQNESQISSSKIVAYNLLIASRDRHTPIRCSCIHSQPILCTPIVLARPDTAAVHLSIPAHQWPRLRWPTRPLPLPMTGAAS